MRTSSCLRLPAAFLVMAALAGPLPTQSQPFFDSDSDVLLPSSADLKARATAVRVLPGPASAGGERVSYRGFNGQTYELTRFHGRHVDVLLPDTWTEPGALPEELIRSFVDRTDLIYQHFLDLSGVPPDGEGRLPVAIVPETCGLGCAFLGAKGVEMEDDPGLRSLFWQEIAADMPLGVIVHELTHNFDHFSRYVAYTPDGAHAWTSFISYYYSVYARDGHMSTTPDEDAKDWLATTALYFQDAGADWATCVRDGQCSDRLISPELAWGGFGFRLALFGGPQAVRGFFAFLRTYRQAHLPPATAEERNDLYLEALAAGARRNLSCVASIWRWPLSEALRAKMRRLYGTNNPLCQDRDRDGFSPLVGDCDDRRAAVRPGAPERLRRVDDDCDGRIDEAVWREPEGGDFPVPQRLVLPAEISGVTPGSDLDLFTFDLKVPARVRLGGCSPDHGLLSLINDAARRREDVPIYAGGCYQEAFALDAGTWYLDVGISQPNGARYEAFIEHGAPWPAAPWARTAPPVRRGDRFVFTAATALRHPPGPGAQVRFWVSGQGFVGTVPYSRAASFGWTPPPGLDPVAEGLTWRAQLLVQGVPAAVITRPQPFVAP